MHANIAMTPPSSIKFQYVSDIHTEVYASYLRKVDVLPIERHAPYLVLAGDIGHPHTEAYRRFLERCSALFERVFVVAGNHEYYQTKRRDNPMEVVDVMARAVCGRFPNVVFLQNEVWHFPDFPLTVFGGTFWTAVVPEEQALVESIVGDYKHIPDFTPAKSVELHRAAMEALEDALNTHRDRSFAIVSHHLPRKDLVHAQYADSGVNSAYASDVPAAIGEHPRILAWFYGHTHTPTERGIFHANPIGYPNENRNVDWGKTIELFMDT